MKKILLIFLFVLLLCTSCEKDPDSHAGKDASYSYTNENISDMCEKLLELPMFENTTVFCTNPSEDGHKELDGFYSEYYFSNSDILSGIDSYVFLTSSTVDLCEVGIFLTESEESANALSKAFETRQSNLIQTYELYSQKDTDIAKNAVFGKEGNLVWFIITESNGSVEEIINSFKK